MPAAERREQVAGFQELAPDVFERALDIIGPKIGALYGLTEAPVTCYLPPRALDPKEEGDRGGLVLSVGRVLAGYEVRIAATDEQVLAGLGQSGEVLVRGGNVMAARYARENISLGCLSPGIGAPVPHRPGRIPNATRLAVSRKLQFSPTE